MQTLEQEFENRKKLHKWEIIAATLMMFEDKGIYDTYLLADHYGNSKTNKTGKDRAFETAYDLEDRCDKGDKELYNAVYEMCWMKSRNRIDDQRAFHNPDDKRNSISK